MKAADAFDGDDLVFSERMAEVSELIRIVREIEGFSVFVEGEFWSTGRTGDRLGMETPIGWIRIFFLTVGTYREVTHRRRRAIIGARFRYGEARSAESTGEKKITISPVLRIGKFRETVVAEKEVWWCLSMSLSCAGMDGKSRVVFFDGFGAYGIDAYVRR